jgi:serine/threonine protein kinase, bacterial
MVITQHLSAPSPQIGERRPELAGLNDVITKVLAKDPGDRYPSCSDFATALTGEPSVGAAQTVAGRAAAAPTMRVTAPQQSTPPKARRRALRPAVLISAVATLVLLAVAGVVGVELMRHRANEPGSRATIATNQPRNGANPGPSQPGNGATVAPPSVQLTRYITDPSGVLTAASRTAVEGAMSKLYTERNVHLWVAPPGWNSDTAPRRSAVEKRRNQARIGRPARRCLNP